MKLVGQKNLKKKENLGKKVLLYNNLKRSKLWSRIIGRGLRVLSSYAILISKKKKNFGLRNFSNFLKIYWSMLGNLK